MVVIRYSELLPKLFGKMSTHSFSRTTKPTSITMMSCFQKQLGTTADSRKYCMTLYILYYHTFQVPWNTVGLCRIHIMNPSRAFFSAAPPGPQALILLHRRRGHSVPLRLEWWPDVTESSRLPGIVAAQVHYFGHR